MKCIKYRSKYKYQLRETYSVIVDIKPKSKIGNDYVTLDIDGTLTIVKGYAWDGPSGPTIDTKTFMRGSLVHDALYQLIREGYLEHDIYKDIADAELRKICREDGMNSFRAWYVFKGVDIFGEPSCDPSNNKPDILAPGNCDTE